ncbi:CTP pyrophosphohydrolase [bacterium BMS3Bbin14]|nr:CTP pyrophosphohydrolase [bacterium BMS3Abin13]GBE53280.1 CTP pyrophosphohydrolase [bacterium BMS3Bbin14]
MHKIIDVAAAVIRKNDLILVARRARGEHLEHKWEFPGGKIEPEETPQECLQRELKEEFSIIAKAGGFIGESIFHYPDKSIRLLAHEVRWLGGDFILQVHDKIAWVTPEALLKKDLAAADIPIAQIVYEKNRTTMPWSSTEIFCDSQH